MSTEKRRSPSTQLRNWDSHPLNSHTAATTANASVAATLVMRRSVRPGDMQGSDKAKSVYGARSGLLRVAAKEAQKVLRLVRHAVGPLAQQALGRMGAP